MILVQRAIQTLIQSVVNPLSIYYFYYDVKIRKTNDFANDISRLKCNLTVDWFGILLENSIAIEVKTIVYNKDVVVLFLFFFSYIFEWGRHREKNTPDRTPARDYTFTFGWHFSFFLKKKTKQNKTTTNANLPWRNTLLWRLIGLPYSNFKSFSAESPLL